MDPLTAFSLACGVIQVADFGLQIIDTARTLYREGKADGHDDLTVISRDFHTASERLRTEIEAVAPTQNLDDDDKEILELAKRCSATTNDIETQLRSLEINGTGFQRGVQAFKTSLKAIFKTRKINEAEEALRDYRSALDTRLLLSLRSRYNLLAVQQSSRFDSLDDAVQKLVVEVTNNRYDSARFFAQTTTGISQLQDHVIDGNQSIIRASLHQSEQTQSHVSYELARLVQSMSLADRRQRFVDSLYFPGAFTRFDAITPAHKATFNWIWQRPDTKNSVNVVWHDFSSWLGSKDSLYWIHGKPGCGKSTLMRYIHDSERTCEALRQWSGHVALLTPAFFFWNPGKDPLEKSISGLIRSLLYQLFNEDPHLVDELAVKLDDLNWTEARLRQVLNEVISSTAASRCYCLFIDGLDELEGDLDSLLLLLKSMSTYPNLKICLSSRPWRIIGLAFTACPQLRVHDLTAHDIGTYVLDQFVNAPLDLLDIPPSSYDLRSLSHSVVEQANGVFLWVRIVVRSIVEGIQNEDSIEDLKGRILQMPQPLGQLYRSIFDGISATYQRQVARSLLVLAASPDPVTVGGLILAGCDQAMERKFSLCSSSEQMKRCVEEGLILFQKRLIIRCGGLLESVRNVPFPGSPIGPASMDFSTDALTDMLVRPTHWTVAKYCDEAREFLLDRAKNESKEDYTWTPFRALAKAHIRWLSLRIAKAEVPELSQLMDLTLRFLHAAEKDGDQAQSDLTARFLSLITTYDDSFKLIRMVQNHHWVTDTWGLFCAYGLDHHIFGNFESYDPSETLICKLLSIDPTSTSQTTTNREVPGNKIYNWRRGKPSDLQESLPLIKYLLENGADPNREFTRDTSITPLDWQEPCPESLFIGDATPWKVFLRVLQETLTHKTPAMAMKSAVAATEAFCAVGADQKAMCCYESSTRPSWTESGSSGIYNWRDETSFRFHIAQTPLSMVKSLSDDGSHFRTLQKLFEARGSRSAARVACIVKGEHHELYPTHDIWTNTTQYILGDQSGSQLLSILKKHEKQQNDEPTYADLRRFITTCDNLRDSYSRRFRSGPDAHEGWESPPLLKTPPSTMSI